MQHRISNTRFSLLGQVFCALHHNPTVLRGLLLKSNSYLHVIEEIRQLEVQSHTRRVTTAGKLEVKLGVKHVELVRVKFGD